MVPYMAKMPNNTSKVWRSIKEIDDDKNGFLSVDELELCFREHFSYELDGKSLVYYFRRFSTDHDKELINYRLIKSALVEAIHEMGIQSPQPRANKPSLMQKSNTTLDLRMKGGANHSALNSFLNSKENTASKPLRA